MAVEFKESPTLFNYTYVFERFRLGASYAKGELFEDSRFPINSFRQYAMQFVPRWTESSELTVKAYCCLLERTGPSVSVAHSQGATLAFEVMEKRPELVKALIAVEPYGAGKNGRFGESVNVPVLWVFGDYTDLHPAWKEAKEVAREYCSRFCRAGGDGQILDLPEMGIRESYLKKQSAGFVGEMEGFLAVLEDQLMDFKPVKIRTLEKTEEELIHLFYFKFQDIPILARMDAVMEYLVDEYETLYNRNLPEDEVEEIREKFNRMYVTRDIYKIYNWFLEDSGYETLAKIPYENRKLQYEDVFPVLYLKYRMLGGTRHKHIKHLVIDEMQDYSYLQYVVLSRLFSCRMTILGDRAQTLDSQMQDVLTFLPKIFGRTIRKIIMNKSYRNTIEIAEYAAKFTGEKDLEYLERHGKPVTEKTFDSDEELLNELIREADAGMDQYETAAVLTETMDEAYTMTRMLSNRGLPVNCIDRDSSTFEKGVTVTTFYMAKGLEFDQVFGVFPKRENPMTGQAKYICATRALHELYMYERA